MDDNTSVGKLVTIVKFADILEAEVLKARLEEDDIHCFLHNEFAGTILPGLGGSTLYVELQIQKKDLDKAEKILKSLFEKQEVKRVGKKAKSLLPAKCPACGSPDIISPNWFWVMILAAMALPVLPFYRFRKKLKCRTCDHKWFKGYAQRSIELDDEGDKKENNDCKDQATADA